MSIQKWLRGWFDYFFTHTFCRCFGVVVNLGHLCTLGGDFKEYIFSEDMNERVRALKRGLGPKSIEVLDLLIQRIKTDGNNGLDKQLVFVPLKTYLTPEEKELGKRFLRELPTIRKRYRLPTFEHLPDTFIFHKGLTYLPPKAVEYLKGKDFIDGGAYVGDSALVFREYEPRHILAFDISDENISMFQKTMKGNSITPEQCRLITSGLGEKDEQIFVEATSGIGANLYQGGAKPIQIRCIDSIVKEYNLRLGLIKLDVEGFESATMRGAVETLKRDRPVLSLSIYHNPKDFFELKPYLESLDLGYKFKIRQLFPPALPKMPFRHKYFWIQHVSPIVEASLLAYPAELDN